MQYGVQVLKPESPGNKIHVSLLSRKNYDATASVVDVFSGPDLRHIAYDIKDVLGNENFPRFVVMPDGSWEEPDEITTFEAMEATYADLLGLFDGPLTITA